MLAHLLVQALAFAAEHQDRGRVVVHRIVILGAPLVQAVDPVAPFLQLFERAIDVGGAHYGQVLKRSGGGLGNYVVNPNARRSGMTTPPAPAACAVRTMAPRLCGSSTPSSTTNNCAEGATSSSSA